MNLSEYFEVLSSAYSAEIDDLSSDFEGKPVLVARLREKRAEIDTMLQMIELAPEMVAPVFHGAFTFLKPVVMINTLKAEPDEENFPAWDSISESLRLADWAQPLVQKFLLAPGGDRFLVSVAAIEYLRIKDFSSPAKTVDATESENKPHDGSNDDEGDSEDQDLAEAGADWLTEQGFDARSS